MYGFKTTERIKLLKAEKKDIEGIVRLYSPINKERIRLKKVWEYELENEHDDYNNFTFVIKDKRDRIIGLLSLETKDMNKFDVEVWIPDDKNKELYFNHVVDSFLEWVQDYTEIAEIRKLRSINNPYISQYEVLGENIVFYAVA